MNINISFSTITCCDCGFTFAVPAEIKTRWRNQHTAFYCPACATQQSYTGETDADKYKRHYESELTASKLLLTQRDQADKKAAGYKGSWKKAKKQVEKLKAES